MCFFNVIYFLFAGNYKASAETTEDLSNINGINNTENASDKRKKNFH